MSGANSRAEAEGYLVHPELGQRLVACAEAAAAVPGTVSALDVFGSPDDMKLRVRFVVRQYLDCGLDVRTGARPVFQW